MRDQPHMRGDIEKLRREQQIRAARVEKRRREREMCEMSGLIRYMYQVEPPCPPSTGDDD
jgi:hypothetical protein